MGVLRTGDQINSFRTCEHLKEALMAVAFFLKGNCYINGVLRNLTQFAISCRQVFTSLQQNGSLAMRD